MVVARCALRGTAEAQCDTPAGERIDGGVESACIGATHPTSARGGRDALAGGTGGQDANVVDCADECIGGDLVDCVRQSGEFAAGARCGASPRSGGTCGP